MTTINFFLTKHTQYLKNSIQETRTPVVQNQIDDIFKKIAKKILGESFVLPSCEKSRRTFRRLCTNLKKKLSIAAVSDQETLGRVRKKIALITRINFKTFLKLDIEKIKNSPPPHFRPFSIKTDTATVPIISRNPSESTNPETIATTALLDPFSPEPRAFER